MRLHHRLYFLVVLIIGLMITVAGMSVTGLLVALNLPFVQRLVEEKMPILTGNMVHLEGISGFLPSHIRLQKLTLVDEKGVWLELDKADMKWSPLALLHMKAKVKSFNAERFVFERLPYSSQPSPPDDPNEKPLNLPLSVDIRSLVAPHIEIGAQLTQTRLLLSLSGKTRISSINPFIQGVTFKNFPSIMLDATARRLDKPAILSVKLDKKKRRADGNIQFNEEENGFMTSFLHMPALDPFHTDIHFSGPFRKFVTKLSMRAGQPQKAQLKVDESGRINLYKKSGKIALKALSPAMKLQPDLGWGHLDIEAFMDGPLTAPGGDASIKITDLTASSVSAHAVELHFKGDHKKLFHNKDGELVLTSAVTGLSLPGKASALLTSSPLTLKAVYHPFQKTQPFKIRLQHDVLQLGFDGTLKPALKGQASLTLPTLKPFAAMGNAALEGSSQLMLDVAMQKNSLKSALKGQVQVVSGLPQAVSLIGRQGKLALNLRRNSQGVVTLDGVNISGQALQITGGGHFNPENKGSVNSEFSVSLPDLKAVYPAAHGHVTAKIKADGSLNDLKAGVHMDSVVGMESPKVRILSGPITLDATASHLPDFPEGKVVIKGELDKSPLSLDLAFYKDRKNNMGAMLNALSWKTLQGHGTVILPGGAKIPQGDMDIVVSKLDAFSSLVGQPVKGALSLGLHSLKQQSGNSGDRVHFDLKSQFGMADYAIHSLTVNGNADHLASDPVFDLSAEAQGIKIKDIKGESRLTVKGPQKALGLNFSGKFDNLMQAPARFDLAALANLPSSQVTVNKLDSLVKGETLRLQSPTVIKYGAITGIEHFKLSASSAQSVPAILSINGQIKPKLDVSFALEHVTPALATPFVPALKGEGSIAAQGKLSGTLADPSGSITAGGQNLYLNMGYAASLPKASFSVRANLAHKQAQLQFEAQAGDRLNAMAKGAIPLSKEGALSVHSTGKLDLTLLNAVLGASGMGMKGRVDMDVTAQGQVTQPRLSGVVRLTRGEFTHYAQGVHLTDIKGELIAQNDVLVIKDFNLKAGKGTMSLSGQIGVLRPGLPLDMTFLMDKAQPVISDLLVETLESSLHIYGQARSEINIDGAIKIPQADINIPDSMPSSVPQLEIIKPDSEQKKEADSRMVVKLNMDVMSPGQLFVHGHGIFAEMSGKLHLGGTNLAPEITGGFDLRQGSFNLAGISLNFTKGRVAFNGSGVGHRLDPTLDFRADRTAEGIVASLLVSGYASEPKLNFVSAPERPKDEVLSVLLFGSPRASLSPTQLAALGAAVVQIGGGSAFDPLGAVRSGLGLDELSVGTSTGNKEGKEKSTLEAGKYVMKGVYVGAKEGLSGNNTQAEVRVDITKHLKFNTTVGTGGQITGFTTPENDPGSSLGLSYGIDY